MRKLISKETESNLLKLGLYQLAGGAAGILIAVWGIMKNPLPAGVTVFLYLILLLFFVYSIFCGVRCLQSGKNALAHSLVNQVLQVIGFALLGIAFKYVAGIYLSAGLDLSDSFKIGFGAGISKFDLQFYTEKDKLTVDINLVALGLIFWIDSLMKTVKEEAAARKNASIVNQ